MTLPFKRKLDKGRILETEAIVDMLNIIERAEREYKLIAQFLRGQDRRITGPKDVEVYEVAVQQYEMLHKILGMPGEARWRS
jgi:hypothetical protein